MDINKIKSIFDKKEISDNVTRQVKNKIKETLWEKQNQREGFTETFKPLISQFEDPGDGKTKNIFTQNRDMIQNQAALTERLAENQLALTQGLQTNRAAITQGFNNLGQALNQLARPPEEFMDAQATPPRPPEDYPPSYQQSQADTMRTINYNIERNFNRDELDLIRQQGYVLLSDFSRVGDNRLQELLAQTTAEIRSLTGQINGLGNNRNPDEDTLDLIAQKKREKEAMQKYKMAIQTFRSAAQYRIGSGINPDQLINRLKLLGGSIMAGNNGVVPEFLQITNHLNSIGVLPTKELQKMLKTVELYLN